ncbi:MAG: FHA domain-containing protein [Anaerolineae bacterium]|nr:FHA domain-containing protein [Anaerolineae bacterium]
MANSQTEQPILIIRDNNNDTPEQHITMDRDSLTLGRGEESDIVLDERQVSRQHIRIYRQGNKFFIEDLESKNGTWVNGQQLKGSRELGDGDEIQLALVVRVQFIGSGATTPLPFDPPTHIGGRLHLDREGRRVFIGEEEIDPPLSLPQYRLIELLYNNMGRICTRDEVVDTVWPEAMGEGVSEQAIDALVRRLRDRLAEVDPDSQYIVTVRGHGFRLDNPD